WGGPSTAYGRKVSIASITDGTSNSAGFSEWIKGRSGANSAGRNLVYTLTGSTFALGSPQLDYSTCLASTTALWDYKGEYWTEQDSGRGGPYYHIMTPNKLSCAIAGSGTGTATLAAGTIDTFIAPSSNHSGGVNVMMLDGSVKFVKDTIALNIWNGLGTINGGEVISADAF
ncbi:DUF1559 family PulG-like putative transporter, partial [Singulisphaera rosea]